MKKTVIIAAALLLIAALAVGLCFATGLFDGGGGSPSGSGDDTASASTDNTSPDGSISSGDTTEEVSHMEYQKEEYAAGFLDPAPAYRWHDIAHGFANQYGTSISEFLRYLREMKDVGVGGVVTNVPFTERYVEDPAGFENLSKAIELLEKNNGGTWWLYDEKGYPSAQAGGLTVKDHPEYLAKGLVFEAREGEGMTPVSVSLPEGLLRIHSAYAVDSGGKVHEAIFNDTDASFSGTSGSWTFYVFCEKVFFEGTHAANNGNGAAYYPNLLNPDAVDAFIQNTYKPYAEQFGGFSDTIGIFTDEPSLMEVYQNTTDTFRYSQLSWIEGFEEKFEQMHGYSVADKYHLIFTGDSDEAKLVRVNYRETIAELLSDTYFGKLREFCEANGTSSSGHCLLEESMTYHAYYYGNLLQCLREMSIPGVDVLSMKPENFMSEGWPIFMAVKYASSVATLTDKDRLVMMELCATDLPATGEYTDEQFRLFKTSLNNAFFCGASHINAYVGRGLFKSHEKELIDYLARLAYLSRSAEWDGEIGLYYPIATVQAYTKPSYSAKLFGPDQAQAPQMSRIALSLFAEQMDFTITDDIFIREAEISNGRLFTENVSFRVILMPSVEVIPLDVMQKLKEFEESGGLVLWIGRTPTLADAFDDTESVKALAAGLKTVGIDEAVSSAKEFLDDKLQIDRATSTLYVGKYRLQDAPLYWLVNTHDLEKNLTLTYEGAKGFDLYDPNTGTVTSVSGSTVQVTVEAASALFAAVKF